MGVPVRFVGSVSRNLSRLIDVALYAYDGDDEGWYGEYSHATSKASTRGGRRGHIDDDVAVIDDLIANDDANERMNDDVSSSSVRRMLAMDVARTPDVTFDGDRDAPDRRCHDVYDNDVDDAIDLSAVERACRDVLDYASHLVGGGIV